MVESITEMATCQLAVDICSFTLELLLTIICNHYFILFYFDSLILEYQITFAIQDHVLCHIWIGR
uniref:Uncharacterized protein n=1 Tax=Anguilla anguilla TaxID=7936 RepID=A0A0E9UXA8_ANGAN